MKLGDGIKPRPKDMLSGWEEQRRVRHRNNFLKAGYTLIQWFVLFVVIHNYRSFPPLWITIPTGIFFVLTVAYFVASGYSYWKEYIRGKQA